jgi:PPOX class probable FMN-dependent enzyme
VAAITTESELRALYAAPAERVLRKELDRLDRHCRRFIAHSPFLVLATADADGRQDATPRGGDPGFVHVANDQTLLLPDRPGNNRLDSLANLTQRPEVGLLFMVPGVDETLRVNGTAELRDDPDLTGRFAASGRSPRIVVQITVRQAYLHCAKALMRSRLWDADTRIDRTELPTMGQMLRDQIGSGRVETQAEMVERYRGQLY